MNNILAVIITYYPDKKLLTENVRAIIDNVDKIIIWENTPVAERTKYRFINHEKVEYFGSQTNSISHGLNIALQYAITHDYKYFLTLDQDSVFLHFHQFILKTTERLSFENAIIGPQNNSNTTEDSFIKIANADMITSGMFMKTEVIKELGGYCEDYNIDAIDVDLCVRAHQSGINLYLYKGCNLRQHYGSFKQVSFIGKKIALFEYSPKRLNSIFKNHIIVYKNNGKPKYLRNKILDYLFKFVPRILLYENHKFSKLKSIVSGIYQGLIFNK